MNNRGVLVVADVYLKQWPADDLLISYCVEAIEKSGMTIVGATNKRFEPYGLTSIWLLEESHFSIHTYPEHKYISIDCYTCGNEGNPDDAIAYLLSKLVVNRLAMKTIPRG